MVGKKGAALPVRLTQEEKASLSLIAEATGLTSSTLIRLLIGSLVTYWNGNNNKLTLPLEWKRLIQDQSPRKHR